jgi:hypothetical protein
MPRFTEADTLKTLPDGRKIAQANLTKLYRVHVPEGKSRQAVIDALRALPEVVYAEANGTVTPQLIPSDTRFNNQWGLRNTVTPGADIHAERAWDIFTGNPNHIIAVIDGGVDAAHVDLNDKISGGDGGTGWNGHGIHVAGIAAAESNNAQGISGVDFNARIHAQRIDNATDDVATYQAIVDAVNFSPNVHVLNNSWGSTNQDGTPGRYSTTVRQAFAFAYKANRTSVVAMGNHQQTNPGVVAFPAGFDNVIAVGATNINDGIANFSAQGNHVDVAAPGVGILSTFTNGGYANQDGTSMATPHVSGIASLLKGFNTNLANDDIENILRLSADDRGAAGFDAAFGAGRVNAERALNFLRAPFVVSQWASTGGGTVTNTTGNYSVHFVGVTGLSTGNYLVRRHEVQKAVTFPNSFCQVTGAWGRGVATSGWSQANPNYGEGFCRVVPGTLTNTGVTLHTFVYEVVNVLGQSLGWYPTTPANVTFAYTVLGVPTPNYSVAGPNTVCSSGSNANAAFTLQNVPAGAAVTWTASSNLTPASGSGTTAIVSAVSGATGNGWVEFTPVFNTCPTLPVRRNVTVGVIPSDQVKIYYWGSTTPVTSTIWAAPGSYLNFEAPHFDNATYEWKIVYPTPGYVIGNSRHLGFQMFDTQNKLITIILTVTNACGTSGGYAINITNRMSSYYAVYPNPAVDEVTIQTVENGATPEAVTASGSRDSNQEAPKQFDVIVYDKYAKVRRTGKTQNGKLTLPLADLPEGLYQIRITNQQGAETKSLFIKH